MKSIRTKHTPAFKAKVALAAIREHESPQDLSKRYGLHTNQIYKWRKHLLDHAAVVFSPETGACDDGTERADELLRKIGELTVERDFLERGLERRR